MENKVVGIDEITPKKITILNIIMSGYKCNWVRHIFNYLGMFILKVITPNLGVISANVGFVFFVM